MRKDEKVKILLFVLFRQKSNFSGKNRTHFGAYFQKGLISDQGLVKRTYLAAYLTAYLPVLPGRKSDQEVSKSDFYQTVFLTKIRSKADPNLPFLRSRSDLFQKRTSQIKHRNFYLIFFFKSIF